MNELEIKQLFQSYLCGQISAEQISRLKELVNSIDEQSFNQSLGELWESYTPAYTRHKPAFDEVSANLKAMIQPAPVRFSRIRSFRQIAAAILVPVLLLSTAYLYVKQQTLLTALSHEYHVQANKGERATVELPDGTKVLLNASSSLSYPSSFAYNNRTVELKGEAYFEVTRDSEHPFIVQTQAAKIRVLGTTFNVNAHAENPFFEASLIEGQVEVMPNSSSAEPMILKPNQKVQYNSQTGKWQLLETDLWIETAWTRGDLVFRSRPLQAVFDELQCFYGVSVEVEGKWPEESFTGSFHEDDIIQVLINLQQHYSFTFRKSGSTLYLMFK